MKYSISYNNNKTIFCTSINNVDVSPSSLGLILQNGIDFSIFLTYRSEIVICFNVDLCGFGQLFIEINNIVGYCVFDCYELIAFQSINAWGDLLWPSVFIFVVVALSSSKWVI